MTGFLSRAVSAATLALLASCGAATAPDPQGRYALDGDAFVEAASKAMDEAGLVPEGAIDVVRGQLAQVRMDLRLDATGVFECHMVASGADHVCTGTWKLVGTYFRLEQTHQDGEPQPDLMTGTYHEDVLELVHSARGMEMPYLLRRHARPAAPR